MCTRDTHRANRAKSTVTACYRVIGPKPFQRRRPVNERRAGCFDCCHGCPVAVQDRTTADRFLVLDQTRNVMHVLFIVGQDVYPPRRRFRCARDIARLG